MNTPAESGPTGYHPPPLGKRALAWRIVLAVLLSLFGVAQLFIGLRPDLIGQWVLNLVGGVIAWVAVFFRRRWPLAVAIICGCAAAVSALAAGPGLWALFSLATTRRWRHYLTASIITVTLALAVSLAPTGIEDLVAITDEAGAPVLSTSAILASLALLVVLSVGPYALVAAWGGSVGNRRELLWSLRERARQAEEDRDQRMERARVMERQRIAREMHDGLAHRISQISLHAGALSYSAAQSSPASGTEQSDAVVRSATIVQEASHQALEELREVLGVLRGDSEDDPNRPLPTGRDLEALVTDARTADMVVDVDLDCTVTAGLSATLGRTVHRIVQESLTNAAKHAPGAPVSVEVTGQVGEHVTVRVSNPMPLSPPVSGPAAHGGGYGHVGLQERVELLDGTWSVTDGPGRFVVRARIPWAA